MFKRLDAYLIRLHHKNKDAPFGRFATSSWGFALTTLVVVSKTIDECLEYRAEGHMLLAVIFAIISALMLLYACRHLFLKKAIDRFEYRLKAFESLIIAYTAVAKGSHILHQDGPNLHFFLIIAANVLLVFFYLLMSRMIYLKSAGVH